MSRKAILTMAFAGGMTAKEPTKEQSPYQPVTPQEITDDVARRPEAGATLAPHTVTASFGGKDLLVTRPFVARETVGLRQLEAAPA